MLVEDSACLFTVKQRVRLLIDLAELNSQPM